MTVESPQWGKTACISHCMERHHIKIALKWFCQGIFTQFLDRPEVMVVYTDIHTLQSDS